MTNSMILIRRLHQHRVWVNENLLASAEGLSEEQLKRTIAIGQGSAWMSLIHMYAAEYVWLETMLGDGNPVMRGDVRGKIPGNQLAGGGFTWLVELRQEWIELARRWDEYLVGLTAEALDQPVYK